MKDITSIHTIKPINCVRIVSSATPTGFFTKKETNPNTCNRLQDIESKYIDKFDDIVYYYDDCTQGCVGSNIIIGDGTDPNTIIVGG